MRRRLLIELLLQRIPLCFCCLTGSGFAFHARIRIGQRESLIAVFLLQLRVARQRLIQSRLRAGRCGLMLVHFLTQLGQLRIAGR